MKRILSKLVTPLIVASFLLALIPVQASAQTFVTVVVQPGDTLSKIANRYCTTWQNVYNINTGTIGPNPSNVEVGMVLTVPSLCGNGGGGGTQLPGGGIYDRGPSTYASGPFSAPYYTVAWGDTMYSVAARFGMTVAALQDANGGLGTINPGQVLYIPGTGSGGGTTPPQPPAVNAERVYFSPGNIAATRTGTINNGAAKRYILGANGGQVMEIGTQSHGEALTVSVVRASNGSNVGLNGPNSQVQNNLWFYVPGTDDYVVTISPIYLPESPQLTFDVTFVIQ